MIIGMAGTTSDSLDPGLVAVPWGPDGAVTALPGPPGGSGTNAVVIDNAGVIAGTADNAAGAEHAVVWR